MIDYSFDGTYIDFDIICADANGLIPQTGQSGNITISVFDSTETTDTASATVSEISNKGIYQVRTPYADLNIAGGKGLWRWTFSNSQPDYTFSPMAVSILINNEIGACVTATSVTKAKFSGLNDTTQNHYKDAFIRAISGNNSGEIKKILESSASGSNVWLTFNALSASLVAGDDILIINI